MRPAAAMFAVIALAGCAAPVETTGVVPQGDDTFTVTRQGAGFWTSPLALKPEAVKEATAYCTSKGKQFKYMYGKDIPAGPLGRWPESEVLFRCV